MRRLILVALLAFAGPAVAQDAPYRLFSAVTVQVGPPKPGPLTPHGKVVVRHVHTNIKGVEWDACAFPEETDDGSIVVVSCETGELANMVLAKQD